MFDNLINQFRPHVLTAAQRADVLACRIVELLHMIAENTERGDVRTQRRWIPVTINGTAVQAITQVPAGQRWRIEAVTIVPQAAGAGVLIRNGVNGTVLYAIASDVVKTDPVGGNVILEAGMDLQADTNIGASLTLQVEVELNTNGGTRSSRVGGVREWGPVATDADYRETMLRHTAPGVTNGVNTTGERRDGTDG